MVALQVSLGLPLPRPSGLYKLQDRASYNEGGGLINSAVGFQPTWPSR